MICWRTYELLKREYFFYRTKESLDNIRYYLDINGYAMPKPKYIYKEDDISTWKFNIDGSLNRSFLYL